jgi:hypothetical protein
MPAEGRSEDTLPATPITVGTKVRLRAPTLFSGRIEGMVIETNESSLLIGVNDRVPLRVSRQAITQLEVSMGRRRRPLKGMIVGAGIGAAVYAIAGVSYQGDASASASEWAHFLGLGMLGGAAWGAGIGALINSDRWSPVPPERLRVSLGATRGRGVRLSVSVGF